MPRVTRRSRGNAAVDNTQGSSFEPLVSLQAPTQINMTTPRPATRRANNLSTRKKRTYSPEAISNNHPTPANPQITTESQPAAKRSRNDGISDPQESHRSSKENQVDYSSRDGINDGRRQRQQRSGGSLHPGRDTYISQSASTTLFDERNRLAISNVESDLEEEQEEVDWHDEATSQRQSTRTSDAMVIERVSWQADRSSPDPGSQVTHASGDTLSDENIPSPGAGEDVTRTAAMTEMPKWPAETDLVFNARNKICLMNQQALIRVVLQHAIGLVLVDLLTSNSFPDPVVAATSARRAVAKAAFEHYPGAAAIHNRLLRDKNYMANMSVIPRARIPIMRGQVKERCSALVAAEYSALQSPNQVAELSAKEHDSYNYIYPVARVAGAPNGRLLRRSLPYRNERIINVIRDLYFTGGSDSFATCFDHVFTRYRDSQGVEKPELPDQMVALVATGLYAAVNDWRTGEKVAIDFTTGAYSDVYDGNVNTLKNMRAEYPNKYHVMMVDLYAKASLGDGRQSVPIANIPFHELDG